MMMKRFFLVSHMCFSLVLCTSENNKNNNQDEELARKYQEVENMDFLERVMLSSEYKDYLKSLQLLASSRMVKLDCTAMMEAVKGKISQNPYLKKGELDQEALRVPIDFSLFYNTSQIYAVVLAINKNPNKYGNYRHVLLVSLRLLHAINQ